jgi:hypothetical protein
MDLSPIAPLVLSQEQMGRTIFSSQAFSADLAELSCQAWQH